MVYNKEAAQYAFRTMKEAGLSEDQAALAVARLEGREEQLRAIIYQQNQGTGYRRDGRTLEDKLHDLCSRRMDLVKYDGTPRVYSVNSDSLLVENIQCVDADGNVFEQYDKLLIDKDIVRGNDNNQ